jgi:integrase
VHERMYKRLRASLKSAGLDETFGFHALRHSYGTALAGQGVPMRTLQEWMGHRDIQTTPLRRLLPEPRRARRRRSRIRPGYQSEYQPADTRRELSATQRT